MIKQVKKEDGRITYVGDTFISRYESLKYFDKQSGTLTSDFNPQRKYTNCFKVAYYLGAAADSFVCNIGKFYNVGALNITDGYWLVFLSPIVMLYWVLFTVMIAPILAFLGISIVATFTIWAILFEAPSDVLNDNKIKKLAKTDPSCPEVVLLNGDVATVMNGDFKIISVKN